MPELTRRKRGEGIGEKGKKRGAGIQLVGLRCFLRFLHRKTRETRSHQCHSFSFAFRESQGERHVQVAFSECHAGDELCGGGIRRYFLQLRSADV